MSRHSKDFIRNDTDRLCDRRREFKLIHKMLQ